MTTTGGCRLRWTETGHGFRATRPPPIGASIVDSWLVSDGQLRSFESHALRFAAACAELAQVPQERTRTFLRAAARQLPREGRWFPRVELIVGSDGPRFELWIRPAPPLGLTVRLWQCPVPDRRLRATIKGSDLGWLTELRRRATLAGGDDALILAPDGRVREAATTSIIWWRGDTLCAPPDGPHILPSVTRAALLRLAADMSISVRFERAVPSDLDGLEVWAVNALHGIRPVTGYVDAPMRAGPAHRAARWNAHLAALAAALPAEHCRAW